MNARIFQPGDAVEWDVTGRIMRGTVESIGTGKNDGIVMVRETGYAKSRPISRWRLRDAKSKTPPAAIGGEVA